MKKSSLSIAALAAVVAENCGGYLQRGSIDPKNTVVLTLGKEQFEAAVFAGAEPVVLGEEPDSFRYVGLVADMVTVPEHWYIIAADAECVLYVPRFMESDGRISPAIGAAWGTEIPRRKPTADEFQRICNAADRFRSMLIEV